MAQNEQFCADLSEHVNDNIYDPYVEGMNCPTYSVIFGVIGAFSSIAFSSIGAAYGTAKASMGIAHMALLHPEDVMRSLIPVVMAGVLPIYGLIVSVGIGNGMAEIVNYTLFKGFMDMGAGLAVGLAGLASGYAVGIAGEAGSICNGMQPKLFTGVVLIQCFAGALGLYGLIVALILTSKGGDLKCHVPPSNNCCMDGHLKYAGTWQCSGN